MRKWLQTVLPIVLIIGGSVGGASMARAADKELPGHNDPQRAVTKPSSEFANPQRVTILGYDGDAMEPFFSRDGKYLFFNNNNNPAEKTDIFYAERVKDITFQFRGPVRGVNTPDNLEGVPSMSRTGDFYFITTRSYAANRSTIYRGKFANGAVTGVDFIQGISPTQNGIVDFDAEISPDGEYLYAVDGDLTSPPVPKSADIFVARRKGGAFERLPNSSRIMANVNTPALEYAPSTTQDGLHLYFTRMNPATQTATIEHAQRRSLNDPFGPSATVKAIKGFVEAPSVTPDDKVLFYHAKVGDAYRIFVVSK